MSFGFAQACESSPKVLFTSTCHHWPSSYRAESIMAILSVLIVSPEFANVTIFTDSKNIIIDTWDYHIFVLFLNNKKFIGMEYCQWNYTFNCQVISRQNTWNNFIDQKISDTHNDNDASIVTLVTQHKVCLTLEWDSRKFIVQTSLVKGFKFFFKFITQYEIS